MAGPDALASTIALWELACKRYERPWGPRFKAYDVLGLDAPTVSWNLFTGDRLTPADLGAVKENFRRDRPAVVKPYVSFVRGEGYQQSPLLAASGYANQGSTAFCFTERLMADENPGRFSITEGTFAPGPVYEDYAKMTLDIFALPDRTFPEFNRRFSHGIEHRVLNFALNGKPVGTACLSVLGEIGWLYGAAVYDAFRRQGVWSTMTRVRQDISRELGAKRWFLQTAHPHLTAKFESVLHVDTYRKR